MWWISFFEDFTNSTMTNSFSIVCNSCLLLAMTSLLSSRTVEWFMLIQTRIYLCIHMEEKQLYDICVAILYISLFKKFQRYCYKESQLFLATCPCRTISFSNQDKRCRIGLFQRYIWTCRSRKSTGVYIMTWLIAEFCLMLWFVLAHGQSETVEKDGAIISVNIQISAFPTITIWNVCFEDI